MLQMALQMTVTMTSLRRAKNGDWFSRKAIPDDVRDAYQTAYGVRREERFRLSTDKSPGEAKAAFAEWLADIEGRIGALRAAITGKALELSHRQLHELAGRWYDWLVVQYADDQEPVEAWDFRYERYQDAVEAFGGDRRDDDEDRERSPRHAAKVRAVVLELSRLQTFLASEGISVFKSQIAHRASWLATGKSGRAVHELKGRERSQKAVDEMQAVYDEILSRINGEEQ